MEIQNCVGACKKSLITKQGSEIILGGRNDQEDYTH